jgi:hypothetical protein
MEVNKELTAETLAIIDMEANDYLARKGINFSDDSWQGYCAGAIEWAKKCKSLKEENSRLKQAQQAIWVKASEPNIKEGEYVAKFFATEMNLIHPFVGMAFVEKDFIRLCCPGHYDKKWRKGHEELQHVQILHESSSTSNYSALKEENEKLNESCKKLFDQNTRFYNDYVALKEKAAKMEEVLKQVHADAKYGIPVDLAIGTKAGVACMKIEKLTREWEKEEGNG